jgi:DNA polymerase-4
MVGDVTFQLLSRIGIRTIQTLSEMPRSAAKMIGKTVLISGKKQMVLTTIQ